MADIKDPENTIIIELKDGPVVIELLPDVAPEHVARIEALAKAGEEAAGWALEASQEAASAAPDELKAKGVAMIFISHHLEELARIAETISVLRDGSFIAEVPADTDEDELVRLMVGREIENQYPRKVPSEHGEALLEVSELTSDGAFHDVTFSVHAGEVVGLAGLVGAGRTEVIRAIAGADPYDSGSIRVGGTQLRSGDIRAAIRAGVGHIPEDRKSQALVLDASVGDNLGFATLYPTAKAGLADRSGQRRRAGDVAEKLRIRMADLSQPIRNLSGGNQQKAVFGRWVLAGSKVLLLDEPTRGVDVGAKVEIYNIINEVTAAGGAVLMASSDLPEVLGMSDRILVMSGGQLAGQLPKDSTQDEVMAFAVSNVTSATSASAAAPAGTNPKDEA